MSIIQVLVDAAVPSEDGIVIKGDFKPGSVERSVQLLKIQLQTNNRSLDIVFFVYTPPPIT
jgi:hypothetical protein